jgi:hypothetical protein
MNIESLGVVYHLSKEDVIEAVDRYLEALGQNVEVVKVEPEYDLVYHCISNTEQDAMQVFDGLRVVCK